MFEKSEKKPKRFIVKEEQNIGFSAIQIIVDTITGVNYIHIMGEGNGITPLLDDKGNIVIDLH
ncbi:MAG: hypothetical protein K2G36_04115 [Ruminococcus sp.]|nr:hypothetical protein [Ruminococcus sp.]